MNYMPVYIYIYYILLMYYFVISLKVQILIQRIITLKNIKEKIINKSSLLDHKVTKCLILMCLFR